MIAHNNLVNGTLNMYFLNIIFFRCPGIESRGLLSTLSLSLHIQIGALLFQNDTETKAYMAK